ncbi:MAG: hypothetical protein A2427_00465 [Candidatus Nealsonbacteria bacterium RIFOXYC1_FULL_40_7]|nr:MAG: hypothetical protein A2427_00465 [Candidatus Nealsonbacteria bacterium RIFOXYC1_FULL_40_7]
MKNIKSFPDSDPAFNQFIKLYRDTEFQSFCDQAKAELFEGSVMVRNRRILLNSSIALCKRKIREFIYNKQLPNTWIEPIYSIISGRRANLPPDNGISIKVGGTDIASEGDNIILIRKPNGMLMDTDTSLSIVVSTKMSTDYLVKFIQENSEQIQYYLKILELPKHQHMPWKKTILALEIIYMKDEENLTFDQIADKLTKKEDITMEEADYLATTENIKTLYYRYKKLLQSP